MRGKYAFKRIRAANRAAGVRSLGTGVLRPDLVLPPGARPMPVVRGLGPGPRHLPVPMPSAPRAIGSGTRRARRMGGGSTYSGAPRPHGGTPRALNPGPVRRLPLEPKHQNWFRRHPVLSGLGVAAGLTMYRKTPGPQRANGRPTGMSMY